MGRRKILEPSTVGDSLAQPFAPDTGAEIVGNRPRWGLQHKGRNEHDEAMRARTTLNGSGFDGFYANSEPLMKIAGALRRAIPQPDSKEEKWRPSVRRSQQPERSVKPGGKRYIELQNTGQEEGDLPRGRRMVNAPIDRLGEEMEMFASPKRRVFDSATGKPRAELRADVDAEEKKASPRGLHIVGEHNSTAKRNHLPQSRMGDKLYSCVEYSPEYHNKERNFVAAPRVGKNGTSADASGGHHGGSGGLISNSWALRDREQRTKVDIETVRNLPKVPLGRANAGAVAAAAIHGELPPVRSAGGGSSHPSIPALKK